MIIPRLNRGAPERIFIACYNDSGSALSKGQLVCFSCDGTRDGYEITDPTAALNPLTAGLAHATTANGDYGLVQIYGLDDDALILKCGTASNANGAIGDCLVMHSAISGLSGSAVGSDAKGMGSYWFALGETMASSSATATTTAKVFIRCM